MDATEVAAPLCGVFEWTELREPKLSCERDIAGSGESPSGGALACSAVRGAEARESVEPWSRCCRGEPTPRAEVAGVSPLIGAVGPSAMALQLPGT
jgi:hypothetical protein